MTQTPDIIDHCVYPLGECTNLPTITAQYLEWLESENAALATRLAEVEAALDKAEQRYQRDCLGLNNEGDPIGGNPPSGWKPRAEATDAHLAEVEAQREHAWNMVTKADADIFQHISRIEELEAKLAKALTWQPRKSAPRDGRWFEAVRAGDFLPGEPFLPQSLRWQVDGWQQPDEGQTTTKINFDYWRDYDFTALAELKGEKDE
jgi:hypothetical protein